VLGFEDLRSYLQARCDAGDSGPRIATELGVGDRQVQAALARSGVRLAPRPQRLAAQRRRYTEQRIAARVAQLGFAEVRAYLVDRVVERAWLLAEVGRGAGRPSPDGAPAAGAPWEPTASGQRPVMGVGCRRCRGGRGGRRGWRNSALRIWPATSRCGMSNRAGRSSGCGPSFRSAAGGWWES
jgi:hypothetical protein